MSGVELLAYVDRLAGDLAGLRRMLTGGPLAVFSGVHLLPFFVPFDGDDAGFDPDDHGCVDPRLGTWDDVRRLAGAGLDVTADLIVNHVSARSAQFTDWIAHGSRSRYDGMFLTFDTVFPHGADEAAITGFYRPRTGLPFTAYEQADGARRLVWSTFAPSQVDLDVHHPAARAYLDATLGRLADGGVRTVRLDAAGYAVKTPGTDSFMTPYTLEFIDEITHVARAKGLRVLVELHAHYSHQQSVAGLVDLVYDFALPPLLLHSLATGTVDRLAHWLRVRPTNTVTVLDTHDGIGVVDAGPSGERPGLLSHEEMAAVFDRAAALTGSESAQASTRVAWARLPHQINSTFFSVLGRDETAYLLARAVQMFVPGRPQVYYVGLLGGTNDMARFARTGLGRDVNRHHYTPGELAAALAGGLTRAQLGLIALRSSHPAFDGDCVVRSRGPSRLQIVRTAGAWSATLDVDVAPPAWRIAVSGPDGSRVLASVDDLSLVDDRVWKDDRATAGDRAAVAGTAEPCGG